MQKLVGLVDRVVEITLVALMTTMVIVVSWQVATRFLLNDPSSITEELASYLLIWISLLGAAYALRRRAHIGIDVVVRRFSASGQRRVAYVGLGVMAVFALLVLVVGGLRLVAVTLALDQISAALQVPIGYVYLILPLSGVLMIFYSAALALELRHGEAPTAPPSLASQTD